MVTMEEASKDLLLYATATSVTFQNASDRLFAEEMPVFAHNFIDTAEILAHAAESLFSCMGARSYGVHFLPGTNVPPSYITEGMSYLEYRNLMFGSNETSAEGQRGQMFQRCLTYIQKAFQASMDAAIRAAKDNETRLLKVVAGKDGLLYESLLSWQWLDDAGSGAIAGFKLFVPDESSREESIVKLTSMEEIGDSTFMKHMPPELIFTRFPPDAGFTGGEHVTIGFGESGRIVDCNTQESFDYIKSVVNRWHDRLCTENGIR